ncbi:MAG: inorganic phosphate transporter [Candidatus Omnitrophica bacterium]|nr:inorganic phosphate transporter [Candidatus Omnitrophota bacterium]
MIRIALLILLVVFFAMNMGASGVAPSFAAAYGGKLIRRKSIFLLFGIFVVIGALALGRNVSLTLGKNLLPKEFLNFDTALVIILAASLSLFLANLLKIPQSTSQVTVGAITGAGLYFKHLYWHTLLVKIIPLWIILPLASYLLTFFLYRIIYPPKHNNLHIYERLFLHEKRVKITAIVVSCYVAFAIGSNNVANAVGPLFGAGIIGIIPGLLAVSPLFGLGALALGKGPMDTAGKEIVPLGVFSSTLVSFVTASLLLVASTMGIPQSLVQLNICSIFAVSSLKNGHRSTLDHHMTRKTFFIWAITPLIAVFISYFSLVLFLGKVLR